MHRELARALRVVRRLLEAARDRVREARRQRRRAAADERRAAAVGALGRARRDRLRDDDDATQGSHRGLLLPTSISSWRGEKKENTTGDGWRGNGERGVGNHSAIDRLRRAALAPADVIAAVAAVVTVRAVSDKCAVLAWTREAAHFCHRLRTVSMTSPTRQACKNSMFH